MGEFVAVNMRSSMTNDLLWQPTLFLLAGLAGAFVASRRPARAHRILLLATAGALITPICSAVVRNQGWGLWMTRPSGEAPPTASRTTSGGPRADSPATIAQYRRRATSADLTTSVDPLAATGAAMADRSREPAGARNRAEAPAGGLERIKLPAIALLPFRRALTSLWLVVSGLLLARLAVSLVRGHRLASRARPIRCESIEHAASVALQRLGLRAGAEIRTAPEIAGPVIWCWGRAPLILLPNTAESTATVDWAGVFCHELAHWVRATSGAACSPSCWWPRSPGIHWPGWPGAAWASKASLPATTGCSAPAALPPIMLRPCYGSYPDAARRWPWRPCRAVTD